MGNRKIKLIAALPNAKRQKKPQCGISVPPENLEKAYAQMFHLQNLLENHIPLLQMDNVQKDAEIRKLKVINKLKDDELKRIQTQLKHQREM